MSIEKSDLIAAFDNSNRNRYIKLFDYYQALFIDDDYLSIDITRKVKVELGITITVESVHYIRSKIMRKRLEEKAKKDNQTQNFYEKNISEIIKKPVKNINENFEFKEPKSINHNQEIVTIRKSQHETD